MKIPTEILEFIDEKLDSELALIGCRASCYEISYDCCEYDIAVLGDNFLGQKIKYLGNSTIELVNFPNYSHHDVSLSDMIRLKNKASPLLISPYSISKLDIKRMFIANGRRKVVDSLFTVSKTSNEKTELNLPLNLKMAAYNLIEGILLISEIRPMPIHELNQLRQLQVHKEFINEAIQTCIECLGIERATRTTINRSLKAFKEILKERGDIELLISKIKFLLDHGLLADCYYYIGKLVCNHLGNKDDIFHINYHKLNSIALDLTGDYEKVRKMSAVMKHNCKNILKN